MQIRKSLDKIIAVAGGCLVFATGGGTVAAGAGLAGSGVALLNAWLDGKAKYGLESERVVARVRSKVLAEFGDQLSEEDMALLEGADFELGEVMLECIPPADRLAHAFGKGEGFVKTAALLVLAEVAVKNDLFAETGVRAEPLARRFALAAIEGAMAGALTDRDYFAGLLPFVLEGIARDTGNTLKKLEQVGGEIAHIRGTADQMAADVQRLVAAFEATATGRDAQRVIGDSRPFVVLARRINQEVEDPDQALAELTEMVELILRQQTEAERGTNLGDLVDEALRQIAEKSRHGEFDAAATEAARVFAEWEERESERRKAERQAGLKLVEANIEQNLLRRDAEAVANWVERRLMVERGTRETDAATLLEAVEEWYDRGEQKGLKLDLEVAAVIARRAQSLAVNSNQRGAALVWLGNALQTIGRWDRGTAQLEEAAAAHRTALEELTRERAPFAWATAQNNLGNALMRLGERESGTAHLEEAVRAYRAALEELTRERVPLDWAMTQNNLGNALLRLGERESGTAGLKEAVVAYRAALEEYRRDVSPLEWAIIQNNLGNVLARLGARESSPPQLEAAVTSYQCALEIRTRQRVPLDWAMTQNNLGNVLLELGRWERGTARLEEAVTAYRAALDEWTQERTPLDWALTQSNLGNALATIGGREGGTARMEQAVTAYRAALEERTRERVPLDWATTQSSLGNALAMLGEQETGTAHLEEAVVAYHAALEERRRELIPLDWAETQNNLGNALAALGKRENGTARLEEAAAAYHSAMEEETRDRVPLGWAKTALSLASTLGHIARRLHDPTNLAQALAAAHEARAIVREAGHRPLILWADAVLGELENIEEGPGGRF
jgi:tetratricopeptide (TPR) repeat protein